MHLSRFVCSLLLITATVLATLPSPQASLAAQPPPATPSLFGLNLYITGRERTEAQARTLVGMAQQIGVEWTREEIGWASWGDGPENGFFDRRLRMLSDAGIRVIGMLLTTPDKQRDKGCVALAKESNQPGYWCAPIDPAAYGNWARLVVERYDGDGIGDAPGSPRVDAWEIWNEPDQDGTWLPRANPPRMRPSCGLATMRSRAPTPARWCSTAA